MPARKGKDTERRLPRRLTSRPASVVREQRRLYCADDHGRPIVLDPSAFAPKQREGGWGPFSESFLRFNATALAALDVRAELISRAGRIALQFIPGGSAGATPLRSAQTGHVVAGLVVRPRFGWAGVGQVLSETGWHAAPDFVDLPLVPGSGREIPPWVLAGPVLQRLRELLRTLRRGYQTREDIRNRPRGTILWDRYIAQSLARGRWHQVPCRFPDLESDPYIRRMARWTLERLHRDLVLAGGRDPFAVYLASIAARLLDGLRDVPVWMPRRDELRRFLGPGTLVEEVVQRGLEAISWIVDERGLGGRQALDGLAWKLPLDRLWESYVEAYVRQTCAVEGGDVMSGRLGQTVFPVHWSDPSHRTLGHLKPDLVIRRGKQVHVIDAKYKAHFVEIDETGWYRFADEVREAHRADIHQILAYAALYDAEEITATLIYPLRQATYDALRQRGREISRAELLSGGRRIRLALQGLPFGGLQALAGRRELA